MAYFVGGAVVGDITSVHTTTAQNTVGTQCRDNLNNEYIYMQGVASTVLGTWVTFDELFITTRTTTNAVGRVAIAMGPVDATTKYGWWAIRGAINGLCLASFADNGQVFLTSTAGSVDDADVTLDFVVGAIGRSARNTTTGLALFELNYPIVQATALN